MAITNLSGEPVFEMLNFYLTLTACGHLGAVSPVVASKGNQCVRLCHHTNKSTMSTRSRESLEKGEVGILTKWYKFQMWNIQRIPMNENESDEDSSSAGGVCEMIIIICSVLLIALTFPITIFFCIRIVQEYERAVIFRLGRVKKVIYKIVVINLICN